jgi:hypothetical protein
LLVLNAVGEGPEAAGGDPPHAPDPEIDDTVHGDADEAFPR